MKVVGSRSRSKEPTSVKVPPPDLSKNMTATAVIASPFWSFRGA